jgi:predicted nuclease of restriction endonuclease-like (RecB) superfamily
LQRCVAKSPWRHNIALLEKLKENEERFWYIEQTIQHGWTRDVLVRQIATGLYQRQGKAITNFQSTLPALQSDLAHDVLKDPYVFDFITTGDDTKETRSCRILAVGSITSENSSIVSLRWLS